MLMVTEYGIRNTKYRLQNMEYGIPVNGEEEMIDADGDGIRNTKYEIQITKYEIRNTEYLLMVRKR